MAGPRHTFLSTDLVGFTALAATQGGRPGRARPGVALGERRLHWPKNVTEPIGAHLATSRHTCPVEGRLRRLRALLPAGPQEAIP